MKIDFHSHILPGIDDGAKTLEESVQLAIAMGNWGFERITCTPHITKQYRNTPQTIEPVFRQLQEALASIEGAPEIAMSAEYRLNPETWPEVLEKGWLMPIEDRYILMEFPINDPGDIGWLKPVEEFRKVIALGLTPILPHPERYFYLSHDELMKYVDEGVMIQSNYGSFAGLYGPEAQANAERVLEEGIVSFLATDMHNMKYIRTIGSWLDDGNSLWDSVPRFVRNQQH
jgi:tyrosine-protein phosphatase YwqE